MGVEPITYRLGGDCSILLSYQGAAGIIASLNLHAKFLKDDKIYL